jgi:hypothetical protein
MLSVFASFSFSEMKLHRNLIKLRIILYHNPFKQLKHIMIICILISYSSKDKKLVGFLLVHNKVLAADDGDVVLVMR